MTGSTAARTIGKPSRLTMFHAYFLLTFLVMFPKGGIKVAGIPLTWGYVLLGLSAPYLALIRALICPLRVRQGVLVPVVMLLPIQFVFLFCAVFYGSVNTGYSVSLLTAVLFLPLMFLLVYPSFFESVDPQRVAKFFCTCIFAVAVWGIVLFFYRHYTGQYLEVPYITVNAADAGQLDALKHNARGDYPKLIATYNNGNLYGVATLILLPMYNVMEKRRWRRGVVLTAMLLTLARTVWAGLVIMEAVPLIVVLLQNVNSFPVLYLGKMTKRFIGFGLMIAFVLVALAFATSSGLEFLLDPSLGGRRGEIPTAGSVTLLPAGPLFGLDESVYGSAARLYGWSGLIGIVMMLLSPVFTLVSDTSALKSPMRMAAFSGLMMYAVLAAIDGAFVLIPVMAFYWFAYTVFIHGWPGEEPQPSALPTRAGRTMHRPALALGS